MAKELLPPPTIKIGDSILKFEVEELGEEYEEKARNELRETPEVVKSAMEEFKNLLKGDDSLYFPVDDVMMLYQFLRPCKFYPKSAYEKVKTLYTLKYKNPKLYGNLLPSMMKNAVIQEIMTVLPLRSQHGRRILYIDAGKWDVKKATLIEMIRCVLLLVEVAVTEYRTQISGVEVIFNLQDLCLSHVCQFGPHIASVILHWAQDCIPLRLKGIHFVNHPYLFNMLFAIFKPFLNEKIRNRIYFHGKEYESLFLHIDKKFLPPDVGGDLQIKPFDRNEFHRLLCSYEHQFEERMRCSYKKKPT